MQENSIERCYGCNLHSRIEHDEIFKDIIGYEGLYQISNLGRVKSLSRRWKINNFYYHQRKEKFLTTILDKKFGYCKIQLHKNNKIKTFKIHRLIAQAFIPNPENKQQINHIDGNKQNNNISNLEWCTQSENMKHAFKIGLKHGKKGQNAILTIEQVKYIKRIAKYYNPKRGYWIKLAKLFNVSQSTIYLIVVNKNWSYIKI